MPICTDCSKDISDDEVGVYCVGCNRPLCKGCSISCMCLDCDKIDPWILPIRLIGTANIPSTLKWYILKSRLYLLNPEDNAPIRFYYAYVEPKNGLYTLSFDSIYETFSSSKDLYARLTNLKLPLIDECLWVCFILLL